MIRKGTGGGGGRPSPGRARRAVLLLGTSLFVYAAIPSAALAQSECGAAPAGPGTVSCPPSLNPYPNGITYDGLVDDLTVVLEPAVRVNDTVRMTSLGYYANLSLVGPVDTAIESTAFQHPGAFVHADGGSVYVSLDSVRIAGAGTRGGSPAVTQYNAGIDVASRNGAIINVNNVSSSGQYSAGILVRSSGAPTIEGQPSLNVNAQTVSMTGSRYAAGIVATSTNGAVNIAAGTVSTTGTSSNGIIANASVGPIQISSDQVTTSGANSTGIFADGIASDLTIVSGAVHTSGASSTAIDLHTAIGSVNISSDRVDTTGALATGIRGRADAGDLTIVSGAVSTTGPTSLGIDAFATNRATVSSATVTTSGNNAPGIYGRQSGFIPPGGDLAPDGSGSAALIGVGQGVVIDSVSMTTSGSSSPGIIGSSADGFVQITSGTVTTSGSSSAGVTANAYRYVQIYSGSVETLGNGSNGISAYSYSADVNVTSGTVTTRGPGSTGIVAMSGSGTVGVVSDSVRTVESGSAGIFARGAMGANVTSNATVITTGDGANGIDAVALHGDVTTFSGIVLTTGNASLGISNVAYSGNAVIVSSSSVTTGGVGSGAIMAQSLLGNVSVANLGTLATAGATSDAINASARQGDVTVTNDIIRTAGAGSYGIFASSRRGDVSITSETLSTAGSGAIGIWGAGTGSVAIASGRVVTNGANAVGIVGQQFALPQMLAPSAAGAALGPFRGISITSDVVITGGDNSSGIDARAYAGDVTVNSASVIASGAASLGIFARSLIGDVTVVSGTVVTSGGSGSNGVAAYASYHADVTSGAVITNGDNSEGIHVAGGESATLTMTGGVTTHGSDSTGIFVIGGRGATVNALSVATTGAGSDGIVALGGGTTASVRSTSVSSTGRGIFGAARFEVVIASNAVTTTGTDADGIGGTSGFGNVDVASGSVTTFGENSRGITATAIRGSTTVSSTSVQTAGDASTAIYAGGARTVTITSGNVVTAGAGSRGIVGVQFAPSAAPAIVGGAEALGPNGGVSITSGSVSTSGTNSSGIYGYAKTGDVQITSTGSVATAGTNSSGIVASSVARTVTVDANAVSVTGGNSAAILVSSATGGNVTIRGLVQSTSGYEVQAGGGATVVDNLATGIIRGQVLLTGNGDTFNNAGLFDALGTSDFGAGSDAFVNSGRVQSFSGAAVFAGLESFTNAGRVEMRDNAVGDTLNVAGAFVGGSFSRLGVDANLLANQADVLITGAASGSTILDVNLLGGIGFNTTGTLVVDGGAGTVGSAFTLNPVSVANPFVHVGLLFDSPNNNFLLVALPAQPVFETTMTGETILNLWYDSADAVTAQLQAARDGYNLPATSSLVGDGRFGGWVQMIAARVSRDTSQTFSVGGASNVFNTSYDQEMWGVQAGLDYQSGATILGVTFGYEKSTVDFDASFNRISLSAYNVGAYAAFQSGPFYINAIGKYDWINADARPGAGISGSFDATSWGLRGNAGLHLNLGNFFIEPGLGLAWVETNIDDYAVAGASVHFNDIHSLRGSAGIRVGADIDAGPGSTLSPYFGVHAVDEFEGRLRNTLTLGQAIDLEQDAPATFGEISGGVTFRRNMLEAFIRSEVDFGGHRDALTGQAGLRIRF